MTAPLVLGVDGGGTTTTAWLADAAGNVLGRAQAGPSNAKAVGVDPALRALDQSIAAAFANAALAPGPVASACLGLAGFDRPDDRELLRAWSTQSRLIDRLLLVNDGELVVAAGTPGGWGIGVIAGTGSIAVGRTSAGKLARSGGWGHLFGDEGSAYGVALAALRRCARRADGRAKHSWAVDPLTDRLCRALGVANATGLVTAVYAPGVDRARIAALAPIVVDAAVDDEEITADLLEPAGRELAEAAAAVARALDWHAGGLPLALAGGFLLATPDVSRSLLEHLSRLGYEPAAAQVFEPVRGALLLARRALD
jgi:N-acetylglucosamine kinase-like BadF-type ATPase